MTQLQKEKVERMRKLVSQFDESGLSIDAFCKSTGITYRILSYWRSKFATASTTVLYSGFREINIVPPPSSVVRDSIVLETSNGITLRFPVDYSVEALSGLINRLSC